MHLLLLMISLDSHGHYFWNPRVMHFLHSKSLPRDYKTCVAVTFVLLVMIIGGAGFQNEKFITFLQLELPNRMGLWKGRTGLSRNLLELF